MITEDHSQKAQLGCGTLILIALIVMMFSNSGTKGVGDLETKVRDLTTEIRSLKTAIDGQTRDIRALRTELNEVRNR